MSQWKCQARELVVTQGGYLAKLTSNSLVNITEARHPDETNRVSDFPRTTRNFK